MIKICRDFGSAIREDVRTGSDDMNNLFDLTAVEDVKQRILRLNSESERQWGHMTLSQTLAHCTSGIQMAMGSIKPKRASFPASLIGPLIKPLVLSDDKPMRRNSPSSPELFSPNPTQCDFERERAELIAAVDTFASRGAMGCSQHPHPFFGRLKPQEWAILMYKHLDHHLRQFGA
jgi:Protein of unknown function (DUF1569)